MSLAERPIAAAVKKLIPSKEKPLKISAAFLCLELNQHY
jgi:hypothetical protein